MISILVEQYVGIFICVCMYRTMNRSRSIYRAIARRIEHGAKEGCEVAWRVAGNQTNNSVSAVHVSGFNMYNENVSRALSSTHHPAVQESCAGDSSPEQQNMSFAERVAKGPGLDDFIMNNTYSVYAPKPKVCIGDPPK